MFGEQPIELGLQQAGTDAARRGCGASRAIRRCSRAAFGAQPGSVLARARDAGARDVRAHDHLGSSPYDRYHDDRDDTAISAGRAPRRNAVFQPAALVLPLPRRLHVLRRRSTSRARREGRDRVSQHRALQSGRRAVVSRRQHRHLRVTGKAEDVGKFKAPTLRNIAVTAPYMHDGSVRDARGRDRPLRRRRAHHCRRPESRRRPRQSRTRADGSRLSAHAGQRADLIAFLRSLTDEPLLHDPRFANPWTASGQGTDPLRQPRLMALSARNHLTGTVDDIQWGDVLVHVDRARRRAHRRFGDHPPKRGGNGD